MRYYELTVTDPTSGKNIVLAGLNEPAGTPFIGNSPLGFALGTGPLVTSLYTSATTQNPKFIGQTNPGALNVEFDLPIGPFHTLQSNGLIRIWGLGIGAISQAWNLNPVNNQFKTFTLYGGMAKGLPLANPAQKGLLAQGIIWSSYGNWAGTEQTLNLIVEPFLNTIRAHISFNWLRGQDLRQALAQTFAQAFPQYTASINITADLIAPSPQPGYYDDGLDSFAKWLNGYTKWLGSQQYADYPGVMIVPDGKTLYAFDFFPANAKTVALNLWDFVGQPTWMENNTVAFQTVLRGDIKFGDSVTFPSGAFPPYVLQTPNPNATYPNSPAASRSTFTGKFLVNNWIEHFANFRQADAASWNTMFRVTVPPKSGPLTITALGPET